jgi:lysophospholipase L1-like esterase
LFGLSAILLGQAGARAAETLPVGSWSTPAENLGGGSGVVTVREFVHSSVGGSAARVRFSNVYGQEPLVIQNVHVAQRDTSTANGVLTTTDKLITFGGASSVTIPVGASAVSDLVAVRVLPLTDIGISFYLPSPTFSAVSGQGQTFGKPGYLAYGGDYTAAATLPPGSPTYGTSYFLAGLDVQGPNAQRSVVAFGASITGGVGSAQDANNRWTDVLAHRLLEHGIPVGVLNSGISGDNATTDGGGPNAQRRFDTDVIAQAGVGWVIVSDFPINNFGSDPSTAAEPIAALKQIIARSHAKQIQVLCSTLTPFKGAGAWTPAAETGREAYNVFVRSKNSGCDGIIDQAKAVGNPVDPQQYLAAYDSGDHLHPNVAGHAAIAYSIDLNLFREPAP